MKNRIEPQMKDKTETKMYPVRMVPKLIPYDPKIIILKVTKWIVSIFLHFFPSLFSGNFLQEKVLIPQSETADISRVFIFTLYGDVVGWEDSMALHSFTSHPQQVLILYHIKGYLLFSCCHILHIVSKQLSLLFGGRETRTLIEE